MLNYLWRISCLYLLGLICLLGFVVIEAQVAIEMWLKYGLLLVGLGLPAVLTIILILDQRMERYNNHENHNY